MEVFYVAHHQCCLPPCLPACLPTCLLVCLYLCAYLPVCLLVCLLLCLPVWLSACLCACFFLYVWFSSFTWSLFCVPSPTITILRLHSVSPSISSAPLHPLPHIPTVYHSLLPSFLPFSSLPFPWLLVLLLLLISVPLLQTIYCGIYEARFFYWDIFIFFWWPR